MAANKTGLATEFAHQVERLSLLPMDGENDASKPTAAAKAHFVTPHDPVVEMVNGGRLPTIPIAEAEKLNSLKDELDSRASRGANHSDSLANSRLESSVPEGKLLPRTPVEERSRQCQERLLESESPNASLRNAAPPSNTHPLFPQLPLYGPPTLLRDFHCAVFRCSSFLLSFGFLGVIVLGATFTSIPLLARRWWFRLIGRNPDASRPFYEEEERRKMRRREAEKAWEHGKRHRVSFAKSYDEGSGLNDDNAEEYAPTEGGKDSLVCDIAYYARRVGLDAEEFKVQTEDGFIITLWHVYNPQEYNRVSNYHRGPRSPEVFCDYRYAKVHNLGASKSQYRDGERKYPVLLIHGLLQSAGAYCANDDDSLAFFLCKSGYDVWLGNNRCGFKPEHQVLSYSDPRMWAWNIRQMGVLDLPALISRVLLETGFDKLGLVCHSQGTTETFVALAKGQRPDLGNKISIFCALAPAVYAGPLIGKMYFKFMRIISPGMFRIFFGRHAFIPFMMTMHSYLPGRIYGALGYRVFSFLFNWTDERWDRDIRNRLFQFSPVYVSSESMRWWLGRECFATQKCILSTKDEWRQEEEEDDLEDRSGQDGRNGGMGEETEKDHMQHPRSRTAWYDKQAPPMALWVAGSDELVDGRRLIRRFERGREPMVRIVHSKIIEEYEHLDVIWAMDMIEKVGKEVRAVLWQTASSDARKRCRVPRGCETGCDNDDVD